MNSSFREAFDKVQAEKELREKTKAFIGQKTRGYTIGTAVKYRHLISAAACLLCAVIGGAWLYFMPTAKLSIDINPSIELGINRFDKVVSVNGYNEEGKEVAKLLNIRHTNYAEAVNQILADNSIAALLSNDELLSITVIGAEGEQAARMLSGIEACIGEKQNAYCCFASSNEVAAAHEVGLSYGKYRAFLEVQALKPDITPKEIADMTMREIRNLIDSLTADEENETGKDDDMPKGHRGSGNGYGHGRKGSGFVLHF